jgi:transposase
MATEGVAMGHAISVRTDYTAGEVRRLAKRVKDAAQARRLLAIAAVLDGASRTEAARIGGMDRQTLRDWVIRFNDQGPDGLINIPSHTIYRALKDLGFSHVSARPKAYKQDPEAMEAFKKTFPHGRRKSARSSRRAHR